MTAVFADTFFWIALADLTDSAHRQALDLAIEREKSVIVTTDEVLVEYLTYFATAHERMRRKAVTHAQRILEDPGVRVVPQSRESFLSGMALYGERPDKGYSLTDCISMQTMRREGLTEVLTSGILNRKVFAPFFADPVKVHSQAPLLYLAPLVPVAAPWPVQLAEKQGRLVRRDGATHRGAFGVTWKRSCGCDRLSTSPGRSREKEIRVRRPLPRSDHIDPWQSFTKVICAPSRDRLGGV